MNIVVGIATAGRREQLWRTFGELARQKRAPARVVVCPAALDDYDPACGALLACPVHVVHGPRGLTAQRNLILASQKALAAMRKAGIGNPLPKGSQ